MCAMVGTQMGVTIFAFMAAEVGFTDHNTVVQIRRGNRDN